MPGPQTIKEAMDSASDLDARRQLQIARQRDQISTFTEFLEVHSPDAGEDLLPAFSQWADLRGHRTTRAVSEWIEAFRCPGHDTESPDPTCARCATFQAYVS